MFDDLKEEPNSTENRMVSSMRLVLALSALLIIYIDPLEPDRYVTITYTILSLYLLYSALIYALVLAQARLTSSLRFWSHWVDIGWYILLISLSSGTNSIFFIFLFFAVLVASFRWGFRLGLSSAIISSVLFSAVGYLALPPEPQFQLNRFLLRPICLLVLGYMIAYRGGYEIALHRRLDLLKEIGTFSNPRFGLGRTIGGNMERLRAFYGASSCLSVLADATSGVSELRRAMRNNPDSAFQPEHLTDELAARFLEFPPEHAAIYPAHRFSLLPKVCRVYNVATAQIVRPDYSRAERIAALLDTRCFISIPWKIRNELAGRLYVTSHRPIFRPSDIQFLLQALDQINLVLENIRLVDQLASIAAEEERQRIARDIHDSVIQPYIGIQMGLASVEAALHHDGREQNGTNHTTMSISLEVLSKRIHRLVEMADIAVEDLRSFITNLRHGSEQGGDLANALHRFAVRFKKATGIETYIDAETPFLIKDRLAAEVFQIISEGLSNIRRHTQSSRAFVRLRRSSDNLILRIENDGDGQPGCSFTPRSITERAEALEGRVRVEQLQNGGSAVIIEIPF